jgi:hypothetical protein
MHIELIRKKDKTFPDIPSPESVTSARVWHCRYMSLEALSQLVNLRALAIASYPDPTFEALASLGMLESLEIVHLPHIKNLSPLAGLKKLRKLSLSTLPSWDSSGKLTVVESLGPIAELPLLEELSLFGVVPESKSVDALLSSQTLKRVRVSKYPKSEQQKISERYGP